MAILFDGTHKALSGIDLMEEPRLGSTIIASLNEGEWVQYLNSSQTIQKGDEIKFGNSFSDPWFFVETRNAERGWCIQKNLKQLEILTERSILRKSVKEILEDNNLREYIEIFEKNKLNDIEVLADLTEDDYQRMGIEILGDRKKILHLFSDRSKNVERDIAGHGPVNVVVKQEKKGGGVWGCVGVLLVILLVIVLISLLL